MLGVSGRLLHRKCPQTRNISLSSKISFIGSGAMAEAMIAPLVCSNKGEPITEPENISVFDVSRETMSSISKKYGVLKHNSIASAIEEAKIIVIAVKPQNCSVVFDQIREASAVNTDDAILLSICAGVPMAEFKTTGMTKIVRSMPNTPSMIGEGVTVWTDSMNLSEEEVRSIKCILRCLGEEIQVNDESFIDMATSISGSGPAYIFMLMEAMIDAGVHMGFPRETATKLVHITLLGSTKYAMQTGQHPATLKNSVTSPAGTTASALFELEEGRFRNVVTKAIWACYRRSLEMGGSSSNIGPGRSAGPYIAPSSEFIPESVRAKSRRQQK